MADEPPPVSAAVPQCERGLPCLCGYADDVCPYRVPAAVGPPAEGLAQLPHLTERELRVLLVAVESRQRLPIGSDSETGRILRSLHTAISEAIYAAQLDARRRRETLDEPPLPECRAMRWNGTPAYDGPHEWHFFTYGPKGIYTGSCSGREDLGPARLPAVDPAGADRA